MSDAFQHGLEATIRYVEQLREQGVRHVHLSAAALEALARPAATPVRTSGGPRGLDAERSSASRPHPRPAPDRPLVTTPSDPLLPEVGRGPVALSPEAKDAAMSGLRARALACQKCPHLAAARTQVVFGVGDIHSPLMFVGEAPGADEDQQGEPFVGRAGQLLTRIIETMGLGRDRVYIGNILKCRPDTPGQQSGNRKPTADEMKTCLPYLLEQIEIIGPRVLVALGATAVEGLFGRVMPITRVRGTWLDFRGIPTMPTYHPAYLLRNQSLSEKRKVWEDMLQVMDRLGLPISDKQRAYFRAAGG
jgi:DNA polymerase